MENHAKYGSSIYFRSAMRSWSTSSRRRGQMGAIRAERPAGHAVSRRGHDAVALSARRADAADVADPPPGVGAGARGRRDGAAGAGRSTPSSYADVTRTWSNGDILTVRTPRRCAWNRCPTTRRGWRFCRADRPGGRSWAARRSRRPRAGIRAGAAHGDRAPAEWLKPLAGEPGAFRMSGVGRRATSCSAPVLPRARAPLHRVPGYRDARGPRGARARGGGRTHAAARISSGGPSITSARATPPPSGPTNSQGDKMESGDAGGRPWRHALDGGWFLYRLALRRGGAQVLSVTTGAATAARARSTCSSWPGRRRPSASTTIVRGESDDRIYPIPEDLAGLERAAIHGWSFQALPEATGMGVSSACV